MESHCIVKYLRLMVENKHYLITTDGRRTAIITINVASTGNWRVTVINVNRNSTDFIRT